MNEAIILNNNAILYLQMGNAFEACDLLTQASGLYLQLTDGGVGNTHRTKHREHRIDWVDFSIAEDECQKHCTDRPKLYKSGLVVCNTCCHREFTTSTEDSRCVGCIDDSSVCPCILSPVIWYNLGLACQILGT